MIYKFFFFVLLSLSLLNCSGNKDKVLQKEKVDPYKLYEQALKDIDEGFVFAAEKKFSEAEINFDNIDYAAKCSIMSAYSFYLISFYDDAIDSIDIFLRKYPADKNVVYAQYLKALIYFEQIPDEKKDTAPLIKAKNQISFFLKNYPNSEYTLDLKFKMDLIHNQLAAKELFVANYYIKVKKWAPAVRRLKNIVQDYDDTIFIEEALHRLVEIYTILGINEEANSYASILGYNYNSSEWYQESYKLINKDYKIPKIEKKKQDNLIKKIIKKII